MGKKFIWLTIIAMLISLAGCAQNNNDTDTTTAPPDPVDVYRAAPRIVDVHAKGVSKIAAARRLQNELGRKLLICVGDGENDIPMLDGADHAFCPGDAIIKSRYKNVCNCGEGAVADVIYKKIPEILKNGLDTQL